MYIYRILAYLNYILKKLIYSPKRTTKNKKANIQLIFCAELLFILFIQKFIIKFTFNAM